MDSGFEAEPASIESRTQEEILGRTGGRRGVYLQAAHESKEDTGEDGSPCQLVKQHLDHNCFVGFRVLGIYIPIKHCVPEVTCKYPVAAVRLVQQFFDVFWTSWPNLEVLLHVILSKS